MLYEVLRPHAKMPAYAHDGDAGMDLATMEGCTLKPLERKVLPTGIAVAIPEGFYGALVPRSGLAVKRGLSIVNAPGTIDSGYRGEIGVCVVNLSNEDVAIEAGERVAQLIVVPYERVEPVRSMGLSDTERGKDGWGSTGTK